MQKWEKGLIIRRTFITIVAGYALGWMFGRSWEPGTPIYSFVNVVSESLFSFGEVAPIEVFASFTLAFTVGTVIVFTADWRKHLQGLLLLTGTIIAVVTMATMGVLLPKLSLVDENIAAGIAGISIPLILAMLTKDTNGYSWSESSFNWALGLTFALLSVFAVGGLLQSIMSGKVIIVDPVITATFIVFLGKVVTYDSEIRIAVLGEKGVGKSLLINGVGEEFRNRIDVSLNESDDLEDLRNGISNLTSDDSPKNLDTHTRGVDDFSFTFQVGTYLPMQIKFDAKDFTGEWFSDFADFMEEYHWFWSRLEYAQLRIAIWQENYLDDSDESGSPKGNEMEKRFVFHQLRQARVAIILVDMSEFWNRRREVGLNSLDKVARSYPESTSVIPVASKSDYLVRKIAEGSVLMEEDLKKILYLNHDGNLSRDEVNKILEEEIDQTFDGLKKELYGDLIDQTDKKREAREEYLGDGGQTEGTCTVPHLITERLENESGKFADIIKESDEDIIYPVMYETREENGKIKILMDENLNWARTGFDHLTSKVEEEVGKRVRL